LIRVRVRKRLFGVDGPFELDVDFCIEDREFLVIFGPSGCGKTTLLRIIAGLEKADSGYIEVDGTIWLDTEKGINLPPQKRRVGFVFQDYALFPNMTVLQNVLYAMRKKDKKRALELLEMADLISLKDRKPSHLSGGQKQRVALIRALAMEPKILLLDEPLSALDPDLRKELQLELKNFQQRAFIPALMVSHDQEETLRLADKVIRINRGKIVASGSPSTLLPQKELIYIDKKESPTELVLILKDRDILMKVKVPKSLFL